VSSVLCRNYRY